MKTIRLLLLLIPLVLTGCLEPLGFGNIARTKSIGGLPPEIDPHLPAVPKQESEGNEPQGRLSLKTDVPGPLESHKNSPAPASLLRPVSPAEVTPGNAQAIADALAIELDHAEQCPGCSQCRK